MRKLLFSLTLFMLSIELFAQCPISVSITSVPDVTAGPVCKSAPVQLVATPDSIGTILSQYVWMIGNDTILSNSNTLNVLANNQNIVVYMETTTGCAPAPDTVSTSIQVQTVELESTANPIITECNQTTADVQVTTTGNGSPSYSYELLGFGTSTDGFFNDVPQGTYSLFTTDSQGCRDTAQVTIVPFECPPPLPSEIITPNGDGFNDTWQIGNIQLYPESEVFIFDRWGQRVYHKHGYENVDGWDAKYIGVDLPVSTYYYLLEIKPENGGEEIIMRGPISVFR
jgi:large repetitive protein